MSAKVYYLSSEAETVANRADTNIQIPSVEYLQEYLNTISALLKSHYLNTEVHTQSDSYNGITTVQYELNALPIESINTVHSENITQDSRHMFVTQAKLSELEDKPSSAEMAVAIDSMATTLEQNYKQLYTNLLNMPDAISKLKDIATLCKEDDTLDGIVELFASKANTEDLEAHASSIYHLTVEDREALNMLLKLIETGCADWDADETSLAYIKNKPEALKADGGNADTVGGLELSRVTNKREHDLYIGIEGNSYDAYEVDTLLPEEITDSFIVSLEGSVFFRKGTYNFPSLVFSPGDSKYLTVCGNGPSVNISSNDEIVFPKNLSVRNIRFSNSTIYIGSYNDIHDVVFENCTVYFDSVSFSTIECCRFTGSTFTFIGNCLNNCILHNRANSDIKFTYKGGNNIIDSNLFC